MLEVVGHVDPEVDVHRLANVEALEQSEIEVPASGAAEQVPPGVSIRAERRKRECRGIEVLADQIRAAPVRIQVRVADEIRTLRACTRQCPVLTAGDCERRSALGKYWVDAAPGGVSLLVSQWRGAGDPAATRTHGFADVCGGDPRRSTVCARIAISC